MLPPLDELNERLAGLDRFVSHDGRIPYASGICEPPALIPCRCPLRQKPKNCAAYVPPRIFVGEQADWRGELCCRRREVLAVRRKTRLRVRCLKGATRRMDRDVAVAAGPLTHVGLLTDG